MIKVIRQGTYYKDGHIEKETQAFMTSDKKAKAVKNTIAYSIFKSHAIGAGSASGFKFDAMVSDELNYARILQTACAVGIESFPLPYTAVGASSNDLQRYCYTTAVRYGGNFVPAAVADATGYFCECAACAGQMILSSEPLGIGAVGAMGVWGDRNDCLAQLLNEAYLCEQPQTVAVFVKGKLRKGVGATDVALSLVNALKSGFAEGKVLEFIGPGIANLSMESRTVIDGAACGLGCFSTVWQTDEITQNYYTEHGKKGFKKLSATQPAYYDGAVTVDLSRVNPMIAVGESIYEIDALNKDNLPLSQAIYLDGEERICVIGAEITGGTYEDLASAAEILSGKHVTNGVYCAVPSSASVLKALADNGYLGTLAAAGVAVGAFGEENELFMDARSVAATAANGGVLTSALGCDYSRRLKKYAFEKSVYGGVYVGAGKPDKKQRVEELPPLAPVQDLANQLLLKVANALPEKPLSEIGEMKVAKKTCVRCAALYNEIDGEWGNAYAVIGQIPSELRTQFIECGVLPLVPEKCELKAGDYVYLDGVADAVKRGDERMVVKRYSRGREKDIVLNLGVYSEKQREMLLAGGIIGYYRNKKNEKSAIDN